MNLAETQARFYQLVTRSPNATAKDADECFLGSADMPAVERVEIYANMYLWRQVDALREDFPKLATMLGDDGFYDLCESYVRECPSEDPDLGLLGRHLPAFVHRRLALVRSDLGDLAALEWARARVFFTAPAVPLKQERVATLEPDEFAGAKLTLIPALDIIRLTHDVLPLWQKLDEELAPDSPDPRAIAVAVWRPRFEVFHTALNLEEALALERAAKGQSLAEVFAAFEDREAPAEAAFAALTSWITEGWIVAVNPSARPE